MKYSYFVDPQVFPTLKKYLRQALDFLTLTLHEEILCVTDMQDISPPVSDSNVYEVVQNISLIFCLPEQYAVYEPLLRSENPPHIVSPLWALSSAMYYHLQPIENYELTPFKIFSGLIIDLTYLSSESKQQAYASCIHHYGGQVLFRKTDSQAFCVQFCTHIVRDDVITIPPAPHSIHTTSSLDNDYFLPIYRFLVVKNPQLSDYNFEIKFSAWLEDPDDVGSLLPYEVTTSWIETSIKLHERTKESSHMIGAVDSVVSIPTHYISNLTCLWKKHIEYLSSDEYQPGFIDKNKKNIERHYGVYENMHLNYLSVIRQRKGLHLFNREKYIFIVSGQYHGTFRACVLACIRFLGGVVFDHHDINTQDFPQPEPSKSYSRVIVCRDRSCFLYKKFGNSRSYRAISHLYLFACSDFGCLLPMEHAPAWNPDIPLPHPDYSRILNDDSSTFLSRRFAPLYQPLPEFAHTTGGVPGMGSLVICVSGFSDLKTHYSEWLNKRQRHAMNDDRGQKRKRYTDETDQNSHSFILPEEYARLEIQHAIRLCGACNSQSLIPHITTHLICAVPRGRKYELSAKYNAEVSSMRQSHHRKIHIVTEDWLWHSIRNWKRQDEEQYSVVQLVAQDLEVTSVAHLEPDVGMETQTFTSVEDDNDVLLRKPSVNMHTCTQNDSSRDFCNDFITEKEIEKHPNIGIDDGQINVGVDIPPAILAYSQQDMLPACSSVLESPTKAVSPCLKYFLLAGGSPKTHNRAKAILEKLGGHVLMTDEGTYDPLCTHLLLWRFERTEKCMCACAAGKWVLYPEEYLTACQESGTFVREEAFEWHNPSNEIKRYYHYKESRAPWSGACRQGRERVSDYSLPYSDLQHVIVVSSDDLKPPVSTLCALLAAGGGSVENALNEKQFEHEMRLKNKISSAVDSFVAGSNNPTQVMTENVVVCSEAVQKRLQTYMGSLISSSLKLTVNSRFMQPHVLIDKVTKCSKNACREN